MPFPFTERPASKRRPALIVSSESFNRNHDHLVLAMITSSTATNWPSDVPLGEWRTAGLAVACKVRFKLFTLPAAIIASRAGALAAADRRAVRAALSHVLAAG